MFTPNEDSLNKKWCTPLAPPTCAYSSSPADLWPPPFSSPYRLAQHSNRRTRQTASNLGSPFGLYFHLLQQRAQPQQPEPPPPPASDAPHRWKTQSARLQTAPPLAPPAARET